MILLRLKSPCEVRSTIVYSNTVLRITASPQPDFLWVLVRCWGDVHILRPHPSVSCASDLRGRWIKHIHTYDHLRQSIAKSRGGQRLIRTMLAIQKIAPPVPVNDEGEVKDSFTDESAFDLPLACKESRTWIEAVLQEPIPGDDTKSAFREGLKDGQRLCRFINCIKPNAVSKINKMKVAFACFENIAWFLEACRKIGLKDTQLFVATDLYGANEKVVTGVKEEEIKLSADAAKKEEERQLRDLCITIYWLGRAVREMADYKGPQLNLAAFVKLSCSRCQEKITDAEYICDGPRNFHTECFKCDTCTKIPEPNEDFKWDSGAGKLFCSSCRCVTCRKGVSPGGFRDFPTDTDANAKICPVCDKENECHRCHDLLGEPDTVTKDKNGKKHCPACVCSDGDCKKPIVGDKYVSDHEGNKYCPDCACQRKECGKHPGVSPAVVEGRKYCPTTCVCADDECSKPFVNDKFKEVNGKRYCPDCICKRPECGDVAGSDAKIIDGKKYCPTCVCADQECGKPFVNDQFKEVDGKRFCPDCLCQRPECGTYPGDSPAIVSGKKYCPHTCVCADTTCGKPFVNDQFKEVEGKRYCPDCMCHRDGCDNNAGPDAVTVDGVKYCPNCVCADEECGKPLKENEFTNVKPGDCDELPNGGNVCRSCLCTLCGVYVGKSAHIKRKGARYCKTCVCTGCKIGLTEDKLGESTTTSGEARYCKSCVCTDCTKGMARKDTKYLMDGGSYCTECVCGVCELAFTGARLKTDSAFEKNGKNMKACAKCVCKACTKGVIPQNRVNFGGDMYCSDCCCSACKKPENLELRGAFSKESDGDVLCGMCVCHGCSTPLGTSTSIKAVGFGDWNYCKSCVCVTCNHAVSSAKKATKNDNTYCGDCVCIACETPLGKNKQTTSTQWHSQNVCLKCACSVCDRPQTPEKPHKDLPGGKKACDTCLCDSCDCVLMKGERNYCAKCTCNDCGVLLDDDEVSVCEGCGTGKDGFKTRQHRRTEKKDLKTKKQPTAVPTQSKSASLTATTTSGATKAKSTSNSERMTCGKCNEALTSGGVVKALEQTWHKECFQCNGCNGDLKAGFLAHENKPYCSACHGRAAGLPDCLGCGKTVSGQYLSFGDSATALSWHKTCFNCSTCSVDLQDSTNFRLEKSKPICADCYAK
eukprot:CFRG7091T1